MITRLGRFVARRPLLVILAWLGIVITLRIIAPNWNDVAHDGDLAHLPKNMTSAMGERMLAEAFPQSLSRSQFVIVLSRDQGQLQGDDIFVGYDAARRMKDRLTEALLRQRELAQQQAAPDSDLIKQLLQDALQSSEDAVFFEDELARRFADDDGAQPAMLTSIFTNRARVLEANGDYEEAKEFRDIADEASVENESGQRASSLDRRPNHKQTDNKQTDDSLPLIDVWTWRAPIVGKKLISEDEAARLIVLQLSTELLATANIEVLEQLEKDVNEVRAFAAARSIDGLRIDISGSAAVGGDMMRSAKAMISNTELFSVILVLLILAVVYRTPLLVAVPLVSIIVALLASTSLVALLTQLHTVPGLAWFEVKVFTTSRIFVTVILFGAGTDYCLFLISRFKEELIACGDPETATSRTLEGVGQALAASSLTTIVGLATMAFSDFGKYRHSGPVIGFCLVIALGVCVTLTPAMMRLMGGAVFWPWKLTPPTTRTSTVGWWERSADWIIRSPGLILVGSVILLSAPAATGALRSGDVSYDFLRSLSPRCPSYQGAEVMTKHFPVGQGSPVTVVAHRPDGGLNTEDGAAQILALTHSLYLHGTVKGITHVRSIVDPLGDFPPGKPVSLVGSKAWAMRISRPHRRTEAMFLAQSPEHRGRTTRFELVLDSNPFSASAVDTLDAIEVLLEATADDPDSFWSGATFHLTGVAAGVRDLRSVTRRDNVRIEILVVLGVLAVLVVILRRPLVCLFLIATVLLSYYVTIGITVFAFQYLYGDAYVGLDWRTPLFLFVILVAIGQDYNVYLATRVFEEQERLGPIAGLRRAVSQTGGIITSCGAIMAGAFISMTSSAWAETLGGTSSWLANVVPDTGSIRGIVELGFALALGVLLDTLFVRSIMVPAFIAFLAKRKRR